MSNLHAITNPDTLVIRRMLQLPCSMRGWASTALLTVLLGGLARLRFGEAAGLTADSHLHKDDGPWLNIYHQWNRDGDFAPRKTDSSERVIAISLTLDNKLTAHRATYPLSTEGTLVSAAMGGPPDHSNFHRDVWEPAQQQMAQQITGWEHPTLHDLRHTFASLLIATGEHPKVIQNALGHAKLSTTMDTCGHLMDGFGASARSAIDGFGTLKAVPDAEAVA